MQGVTAPVTVTTICAVAASPKVVVIASARLRNEVLMVMDLVGLAFAHIHVAHDGQVGYDRKLGNPLLGKAPTHERPRDPGAFGKKAREFICW